MGALAVGYAAVAALARPFTVPADVATGLAVLLVLAVASRPATPPDTRPAAVPGRALWLVPLALLTAVELGELASSPRGAHPTISSLVVPLLAHWAGRAMAYLAWLALGWGLARR